jgi:hypothetical protein
MMEFRETGAAGRAVEVVEAFLEVTRALSDEAAARLAGVRVETMRKWRRRRPRWIKASTAECLAAHLAGRPAPARSGQSLHRAFQRVMRQPAPAE